MIAVFFFPSIGAAIGPTSPNAFALQVFENWYGGNPARAWAVLHPAEQKLIGKSTFLACSRSYKATTVARIRTRFKLIRTETFRLHGYPEIAQRTMQLVTFRIPATKVAGIPQHYENVPLGVVSVQGAWRWLLSPATEGFYRAHPGTARCGF